MKHRRLWLGVAVLAPAIATFFVIQGRIREAGSSADGVPSPRSVSKVDGAKATGTEVKRWRADSTRGDGREARDWKPDSYEHNLLRDIVNPFDQEELARLAADPEKNPYRLTDLIHRAAAEKDVRFRYLVDQNNLRLEPAMDLAVSAYDYAVNGSQDALNHILEIHAKQAPGSDSDSLVTLSYIDEWERTIEAYHSHFAKGADGAGGDAKYAFLLTREYLFPQSYRKFKKQEK